MLQAAQRELYEETNITYAEFSQEPVFYNETELILRGTLTLFRVKNSAISHENFNDQEKLIAAGSAWWNINDLKTSNEIIFPKNLISILPIRLFNSKF